MNKLNMKTFKFFGTMYDTHAFGGPSNEFFKLCTNHAAKEKQ